MPVDKAPESTVGVIDDSIGSVVAGRYRLESVLGHGGMASVYRAEDLELPREVALKLMPPGSADPEEMLRQRGEVATLASLSHHALVTLFDAGSEPTENGDRGYLVMELIDGPNLRQALGEPMPPQQVAHIGADIAEALHCIHGKGIVHRDVKPANILLAPSELPDREFHAKLADFGIARLADAGRLTSTGVIVGSANYLSPEQARGGPVGPASDVYSLGLVLLEALTGQKAFPGTTVETISARLVSQPVVPSTLGEGWVRLLSAMTALDPSLRPEPMDVVVAARALSSRADGDDPAEVDTFAWTPTAAFPAPAPPPPPSEDAGGADTVATKRHPTRRPVAAAPEPRRLSRAARRRAIAIAAAGVLTVGTAAGVISWTSTPQQPTSSISYPSVSGSLGMHLKELQRNVMP